MIPAHHFEAGNRPDRISQNNLLTVQVPVAQPYCVFITVISIFPDLTSFQHIGYQHPLLTKLVGNNRFDILCIGMTVCWRGLDETCMLFCKLFYQFKLKICYVEVNNQELNCVDTS